MKYKKVSEINDKYKTKYKKIIGFCNGIEFIQYLLNNNTLLKVNKRTKTERFFNLKYNSVKVYHK